MLRQSFRVLGRFTSVHKPIFWRSHYEIPIAMIVGLIVAIAISPWLIGLERSLAINPNSIMPMSRVGLVGFVVLYAGAALFWSNKISDRWVPLHACRVANAPSAIVMIVVFLVSLTLVFVLAVQVVELSSAAPEADIGKAWSKQGFDKLDFTKNGWLISLSVSFFVMQFVKLRMHFGFGWAAGALGAIVLWFVVSVMGLVFWISVIWPLTGIYVVPAAAAAKPPVGTWLQITNDTSVAFLLLFFSAIVLLPIWPLIQSLRKNVRTKYARLSATMTVWLAPYMLAALPLFVIAAALSTKELWGPNVSTVNMAPSVDLSQVVSGMPVTWLYTAVGLLIATLSVHLACIAAVRLQTLPEA